MRIAGTLLVLVGLANQPLALSSPETVLVQRPGDELSQGAQIAAEIGVFEQGDVHSGAADPGAATGTLHGEGGLWGDVPAAEGALKPVPWTPITRIRIGGINLDTPVVAAQFRPRSGGWDVPPFKAGHAQFTAGAGEAGNAVIVGHVASQSAGNVFRDLQRARVGDPVDVWGGAERLRYEIVDVRVVSRTDSSVLDPTDEPSVSLLTCTGTWLPKLGDYSDRLVVRAVLSRSVPE